MSKTSCGCSHESKKPSHHSKWKYSSALNLILLTLLPKCPFCLLAYTSFFVTFFYPEYKDLDFFADTNSNIIPIITIFFCGLIILGIYRVNRKNKPLFWILAPGILGTIIIIVNALIGHQAIVFYMGIGFLLFSIFRDFIVGFTRFVFFKSH